MPKPRRPITAGPIAMLAFVVTALSGGLLASSTPAWARQQGQRQEVPPGGGGGGDGGGEDGLTCGWCVVVPDSMYVPDEEDPFNPFMWHWIDDSKHAFPNGGDACGWGAPEGADCSRCGSTTAPCHSGAEYPAHCHIACGGDALARVGDAIEDALEHGDSRAVAELLGARHDRFTIRFVAAGGRVTIDAQCDKSAPARQYPVPVAMREELLRLLAE